MADTRSYEDQIAEERARLEAQTYSMVDPFTGRTHDIEQEDVVGWLGAGYRFIDAYDEEVFWQQEGQLNSDEFAMDVAQFALKSPSGETLMVPPEEVGWYQLQGWEFEYDEDEATFYEDFAEQNDYNAATVRLIAENPDANYTSEAKGVIERLYGPEILQGGTANAEVAAALYGAYATGGGESAASVIQSVFPGAFTSGAQTVNQGTTQQPDVPPQPASGSPQANVDNLQGAGETGLGQELTAGRDRLTETEISAIMNSTGLGREDAIDWLLRERSGQPTFGQQVGAVQDTLLGEQIDSVLAELKLMWKNDMRRLYQSGMTNLAFPEPTREDAIAEWLRREDEQRRRGSGRGSGRVYRMPDPEQVKDNVRTLVRRLIGRADDTQVNRWKDTFLAAHRYNFDNPSQYKDPQTAVLNGIRGTDAYKQIHAMRPDTVDEMVWLGRYSSAFEQVGLASDMVDDAAIDSAIGGVSVTNVADQAMNRHLVAKIQPTQQFFDKLRVGATTMAGML